MQQKFHTRNYSVRDFEEWLQNGELVLAPKFQRREVWGTKAKSYLIDTILVGKPIPKLYMRQDINPESRRTTREIVDGQQRLGSVLNFIQDGFRMDRAHSHPTKFFSGLPEPVRKNILKYEFVVDLLEDMPDGEVYDVFARINTYSERLKPQELRNAKWYGDFKSCVYGLSRESVTFFEKNQILTAKQILRMGEAELISELVLAMEEGIREGNKKVLDSAFARYDDRFPRRKLHEKRFAQTIDLIGAIFGDTLPNREFSSVRLFYPLFCALVHLNFGLRGMDVQRRSVKTGDYAGVRSSLDNVEATIERIRQAKKNGDGATEFTAEQNEFYRNLDEHWVHEKNRRVMTKFICRAIVAGTK